jgi:hypothetical protein
MTLNNWLQGRYGTTKYLTWDAIHVGPQDAGEWIVVALCKIPHRFAGLQTDFTLRKIVNNIEHGRGVNRAKGAAAEVAAHQALVALRGY